MIDSKSFLFVSIDGMTDPLGQSQVLPYLIGLSKEGYTVSIASCEKKNNWNLYHPIIEKLTHDAGIEWNYCFYQTGFPLLSQIQNYFALKKEVLNFIFSNKSKTILHCRSYLPGLIGLNAKQKFGTGFIFDMRGFWADERIEGNIWSKSNPIGAFLYSFLKRKKGK